MIYDVLRKFFQVFILLLCTAGWAQAEEVIEFDNLATSTFWKKLYPGGGWSLYCGYKFANTRKTKNGHRIDIEHIFPANRMAEHSGCENRMQCREANNQNFIRMEADLHNLYPVWQTVITHRYDFRFGLINGEEWRFQDCDIEWKAGIVEPRQIARGNIARAMLYMHSKYDIPLQQQDLILFKVWNKMDPPSKQEKVRNNIIERLQGNRNPYVDRPRLAETSKLTLLKLKP
ncbi:MAG: endonuclease I [Gammaproteobacteria bacterium]|nr:endonuclease I [Gammaproteobacteria bacterium]